MLQANRRGFIAALFAPLVARFLPKPKPKPSLVTTGWATGPYPKIGDTILIRKPPRFVSRDLFEWEPWEEEREQFVIKTEEDLKFYVRSTNGNENPQG